MFDFSGLYSPLDVNPAGYKPAEGEEQFDPDQLQEIADNSEFRKLMNDMIERQLQTNALKNKQIDAQKEDAVQAQSDLSKVQEDQAAKLVQERLRDTVLGQISGNPLADDLKRNLI